MSEETGLALTREWYEKLEAQASANFINMPMEMQMLGYDYNFIASQYLLFFKSDNKRSDKLKLAKKFKSFIDNINKNRAREELGEKFWECFLYFKDNFKDLLSKNDFIKLETLGVITDAVDKSKFIEDVISIDELKNRITRLEIAEKQEEIIDAEWEEVEGKYKELNASG